MGNSVTVSFNTDSDGFLSQECPSCERRFKAKLGEGSDQPISFCPYCGHSGRDCWWTPEQVEYLSTKVSNEVIGPQLDAMARDFNRKTAGGFVSMSMEVSKTPIPLQPYEPNDDWPKAKFECCNEVIKHDGKVHRLHCIICGSDTNGIGV